MVRQIKNVFFFSPWKFPWVGDVFHCQIICELEIGDIFSFATAGPLSRNASITWRDKKCDWFWTRNRNVWPGLKPRPGSIWCNVQLSMCPSPPRLGVWMDTAGLLGFHPQGRGVLRIQSDGDYWWFLGVCNSRFRDSLEAFFRGMI